MAKSSGITDYLFLSGKDMSGDVGSVDTIEGRMATLDVTGLQTLGPERIHGQRDGKIGFKAWFNPTLSTGSHPILSVLPTTDVQTMYYHSTTVSAPAIGDPTAMLVAKQTGYKVDRAQDGSLAITIDTIANAFGLEFGQSLTAGKRTDTVATNGASLDDLIVGITSAFGMSAYLQVFAFTGTSITVKVQDSADNATFADVTGLSFTAVTAAPAFERLQTTATLSIRRYLRVISTGTFNPCTFVVGVTRHLTASL